MHRKKLFELCQGFDVSKLGLTVQWNVFIFLKILVFESIEIDEQYVIGGIANTL